METLIKNSAFCYKKKKNPRNQPADSENVRSRKEVVDTKDICLPEAFPEKNAQVVVKGEDDLISTGKQKRKDIFPINFPEK